MGKFDDTLICLDNGHAKETPGKRSPYAAYKVEPALEFYEYEFNRDIVTRLHNRLEEAGIETYIVVPEVDKDISLKERYSRANKKKADSKKSHCLFLSIHANAFGDGKTWTSPEGWSAWTTKGQNNSDKFADCLYDAAETALKPYGIKVRYDKSDGDRDYEEDFTVIKGANMPAVLTENLFYTNINETKFLLSDEGRDTIVEIHFRGILSYINKYWREG